jgi:hypothetical protein
MNYISHLSFWWLLLVLAPVAFVQNMAFTWVSRSRNGGDVGYHRKAAICSNGIWFACQLVIQGTVWNSLTTGRWWQILIVGAVYVTATTEGSCLAMARLLRSETGKRQVGAR